MSNENLVIRQIGILENGIDGRDEYVHVKCIDGDTTTEVVSRFIADKVSPAYAFATNHNFRVRVSVPDPTSPNEFLGIIYHRFD